MSPKLWEQCSFVKSYKLKRQTKRSLVCIIKLLLYVAEETLGEQ